MESTAPGIELDGAYVQTKIKSGRKGGGDLYVKTCLHCVS